jgi:hypothetical protein
MPTAAFRTQGRKGRILFEQQARRKQQTFFPSGATKAAGRLRQPAAGIEQGYSTVVGRAND